MVSAVNVFTFNAQISLASVGIIVEEEGAIIATLPPLWCDSAEMVISTPNSVLLFLGNSFQKTIGWAPADQASRVVTTVLTGSLLCQAGCRATDAGSGR